jgi:hypothetical protein
MKKQKYITSTGIGKKIKSSSNGSNVVAVVTIANQILTTGNSHICK